MDSQLAITSTSFNVGYHRTLLPYSEWKILLGRRRQQSLASNVKSLKALEVIFKDSTERRHNTARRAFVVYRRLNSCRRFCEICAINRPFSQEGINKTSRTPARRHTANWLQNGTDALTTLKKKAPTQSDTISRPQNVPPWYHWLNAASSRKRKLPWKEEGLFCFQTKAIPFWAASLHRKMMQNANNGSEENNSRHLFRNCPLIFQNGQTSTCARNLLDTLRTF